MAKIFAGPAADSRLAVVVDDGRVSIYCRCIPTLTEVYRDGFCMRCGISYSEKDREFVQSKLKDVSDVSREEQEAEYEKAQVAGT